MNTLWSGRLLGAFCFEQPDRVITRFRTRKTASLLAYLAYYRHRSHPRDVLLEAFGSRLMFPKDFVGRGDMSRGSLLLRAARHGIELPYVGLQGAVCKGRRAPRMAEMKET